MIFSNVSDIFKNETLIPNGIVGVADDTCLLAAIHEDYSTKGAGAVFGGGQKVLQAHFLF